MFAKGSRYRNLPESSPVDADGERKRGKQLRLIAQPESQFLHAVQEKDRLDLLAYKYYGDPTRWWQIADANAAPEFPLELLDRRPLVEEELTLRPIGFAGPQMIQLMTDLIALGEVRTGEVTYWDLSLPAPFDGTKPREPDFVESNIVVLYPPAAATHQQIVDAINKTFHFLSSFAWVQAGKTAEVFAFEDPVAKANWRTLVDRLNRAPGIVEMLSEITEAKLRVVYCPEMLLPETLVSLATKSGFSIEPGSASFSRIGTSIRIPPNQIT